MWELKLSFYPSAGGLKHRKTCKVDTHGIDTERNAVNRVPWYWVADSSVEELSREVINVWG